MSSKTESIRRALRVHGARSTIPVVVQKVNLSLFLISLVNTLFFYFILVGMLQILSHSAGNGGYPYVEC